VDRECFGKAYWKIHRKMDAPVLLLGKKHRVLFHDPVSAMAIADLCFPGDPNARNAALMHIELDEMCTTNPQRKKQLEILANEDADRRKRTRRRRKKTQPVPRELKKSQDFFKKINEVLSLHQLIRA
jgi:hypothetical protein